jgi:hypothetical protein
MKIERLRELLANELEKLDGIAPLLITGVRDGSHGKHISAVLVAMQKAIEEDRNGK